MARNNGRDGIPRIGRPDRSASVPGSNSTSGDSRNDHPTDTGPVDIAALRRDDELIEAIRGDGPVATDDADDYQLALLLANWRAEIVTPALPAGPDLDEVAAAVDKEIAASGLRRSASSRRRSSLLRPVAGAAAAIAVVLGGLVVFSYDSSPGDPLWNVKSVVFSQQAESTVAQLDATSKLEQAEQLIASGDVTGARALLAGAAETKGSVIDEAQRTDLEMWLQRLLDEVQAVVPTIPPAFELPTDLLPPIESVLPEQQTNIPLTSVPEVPPVSTTTDAVAPSVTGEPTTTVPSEAPVTPTSDPVPTTVREPSSTTATASGPNVDGTTQPPGIDSLDNGG